METHRNLPEGPIASFRNPTALDSSIRTDTKAQSLPTSRQFSMLCRLWSHSWSFSGPNSSPLYFNTFFPIHHLMLCVYVTVPLSPCHFIPSFLFLHRKSLGPQRVSECDACSSSLYHLGCTHGSPSTKTSGWWAGYDPSVRVWDRAGTREQQDGQVLHPDQVEKGTIPN